MARIRTIKPEFWKHEELSCLPEATHMLAAALLNYADDDGYFNANPHLIKAECCPLREPSVSIQESIRELARIGYIRLGTGTGGRRFGHIVAFLTHQRVSHPTPSKIKELDILWDSSGNPPGELTEASALNRIEGNRIEGTPERKAPAAVAAPEDSLWANGVSYLKTRAGKSEPQARSLIGKWVKASSSQAVVDLIARAQAEKVIEPVAFIEACLKRAAPKSGTDPGGYRPMASGAGG